MSKPLRVIAVASVLLVIGAVAWWWLAKVRAPLELTLYGNVDLRQVELPFNGSERIAEVLVQEGDHVTRGQVLAPPRHQPARAAGRPGRRRTSPRSSGRSTGCITATAPRRSPRRAPMSTPAAADAVNARAQFARLTALSDSSRPRGEPAGHGCRQGGARQSREARLAVNRQGPGARAGRAAQRGHRPGRGAAARRRGAARAAASSSSRTRTSWRRSMRSCARASSSRARSPRRRSPAFTLAIIDPKWVRAYVAETDLGVGARGHEGRR